MTEVRARTIRDFCRAYGVGRSMTYELIRAGRLRAVKAGARTLIDEDSARVWFASLQNDSNPKEDNSLVPKSVPKSNRGLRRKAAADGGHSDEDNRAKSSQ